MSRLIPTRHHNPCPLCSDVKGDCRISSDDNLILCKDIHESVSGFKFLGESSNGLWGKHLRLGDDFDLSGEKADYLANKAEAERIKRETRQKEALPVEARHRHYLKISRHLGLTHGHREKLIERGLTISEIEKGNFFTVNGYTTVPTDTPFNLPGVFGSFTGEKQMVGANAIFCPAFDYDGQIIGGQYRHDREENKYTWAKGYKSSHLANGELPLTIVRAELFTEVQCQLDFSQFGPEINPIMPLEGLLKPFVASCRFGVDTIGASGFNFTGGKEQLQDAINCGGYNLAVFPLDGGLIFNSHLTRQLEKNIKLFQNLGCHCAIAWWGQITKQTSDFDELESLEAVKLVTLAEFNQILQDNALQPLKTAKSQAQGHLFDAPLGQVVADGEEALACAQKAIKTYTDEQIAQFFTDATKFDLEEILEQQEINQFQSYLIRLANQHKRGHHLRIPDCNPEEIIFTPELLDHLAGITKDTKIIIPEKYQYPQSQINWKVKLTHALMNLGIKHIFDCSQTGSGKSHSFSELNQSIYITSNYKNPTVDNWRKAPMLIPRSQSGLYSVQGQIENDPPLPIRQIAQQDNCVELEIYQIMSSNCDKKSLFRTLQNLGYDVEGENNPICQRCQHKSCAIPGLELEGSGFKAQRKQAISQILAQGQGRCHSSQLTLDLARDKFNDFIGIYEEAGSESLVKKTKFTTQELNRIIAQIALMETDSDFPQSFKDELINCLNQLKQLINPAYAQQFVAGKYYGLLEQKLRELIPHIEINERQFLILAEEFNLNIEEIMPDFYGSRCQTSEPSKEAQQQRQILNRAIEQQNWQQLQNNLNFISANAVKLIFWLIGANHTFGSIHSETHSDGNHYGKEWAFYVCQTDRHQADLTREFRANVYLSATAHPQLIRGYFAIADQELLITICNEVKPLKNLTVLVINTSGLKSNSYSAKAINQVQQALDLIKQIHEGEKVSILCLKKYKSVFEAQGHFMNDDRGSNDFQGDSVMINVGSPNPDVGQAQIEYHLLYGNDCRFTFAQYYQHLIQELRIQAIGRQRVQNYPKQTFVNYIFSTDENLDYLSELGLKVEYLDFAAAFPSLAKGTVHNLFYLAKKLVNDGLEVAKLTLQKIADVNNTTRQAVHDTLKRNGLGWPKFKEFCQGLLLEPYKDSLTSYFDCLNGNLADGYEGNFWDVDDLNQALMNTVEVIKKYGVEGFFDGLPYLLPNYSKAQEVLLVLLAIADRRIYDSLALVT